MSDHLPRKQRGNELGATGATVAANLKRIRTSAGITQAQLSERLSQMGHPIKTASIGKIESADRRVEVDDLMALALALDTSPLALLLPVGDFDEHVDVTGARGSTALLWAWATGEHALTDANERAYQARSLPAWLHVQSDIEARRDYVLSFGVAPADVTDHIAVQVIGRG